MMTEDLFRDVELQTPSNTDTSVKNVIMQDAPSITSPEWHDFVMSQFDPSEVVENNKDKIPLTAGLRRVAELLLGRIVFSGPTQIFPPKDDNSHGRAVVAWKIEFENGSCFSDVADCWEGNTDDMFCAYAVATAATRAEARALRKALRIRAVAFEEVTKKDTASIVRAKSQLNAVEATRGEYEDQSRMTDNQCNFIGVKCQQLNINPTALLKELFNVSSVKRLSKKMASDVIDELNKFQRESVKIPQSIVGYVEDWRNV